MGELLGRAIVAARKERGITQQALADEFGISRPAVAQWEAGTAEPSSEKLSRLGELLRIDILSAMRGQVVPLAGERVFPAAEALPEPNALRASTEIAPDFTRFSGPRNIPVRGIAVAGDDDVGDFSFNGETIDFAPRPANLAHRKDVYCIHTVNDSMYPAFRPGAPLYVDPHRAPHVGDDVVVELVPDQGETAGRAYIKRLVKRTPTRIVVEQFNPPRQIEFDRADVLALHRVIPWEELLGV